MFSLNKAQLIGNVGTDISLKTTTNSKVVSFRLATNESYKKDDNYVEKTEWHNVVAWGKHAEVLAERASKGSKVYISGKLQTRSWEDPNGKHYTTEVIVDDFILLDSKPKEQQKESKKEEDLPF